MEPGVGFHSGDPSPEVLLLLSLLTMIAGEDRVGDAGGGSQLQKFIYSTMSISRARMREMGRGMVEGGREGKKMGFYVLAGEGERR